MICWNQNDLPSGINFYKLPVDPCPVSCQTALWSVGMLTYCLRSSEAAKLQIALQVGPAGLLGPAPQSQESEWAESPSLREISCPDCNLQSEKQGGSNSTATGNWLKDDDQWRSLTELRLLDLPLF